VKCPKRVEASSKRALLCQDRRGGVPAAVALRSAQRLDLRRTRCFAE